MSAAPTVVAPRTGRRPPWGTPDADELAARGYVVDEYTLEGVARGYELTQPGGAPVDGRWEVAPYAEAPYRTRLLVVRPEHPGHFNGTVVVNWQNVSAGAEPRTPAGDELYCGYAWVGVSAQEVGIHGFPAGMGRYGGRGRPLVVQDPARYGDLHHPGDQASFDIFEQAGVAVGPRRSAVVDPLAGLAVRRLIATGGSQSAMRLVAYLNAFHLDAPVFDGFLLSVWEGRAPRPEEGAIASGVRTAIRSDLTTPVVVVNSEFEAHHLAGLPVTDTEHLRIWEVAGTPHGVASGRAEQPDARRRVVNRLSIGPVHEAALRALHGWLTDGTPAPSQPRIAVDAPGRPTLRRDELGNVVGGIRLPELEAPTHEYHGVAFGTGRAPLFGAARPLDDEAVRARFPTRAAYVARWHDAVDALVATGALRPEDAPATKARVDEVSLPLP